MPSLRQGSIPLFRLAGVSVSLHYSWFLIAIYRIQSPSVGGTYSSMVWNVFELLALFFIVLTHEFGHALACRQVGGKADRIMLWPFGGVAYVDPPQRPGAMLWSIAAGPLVNVVLVPILYFAATAADMAGWASTMPDLSQFMWAVSWINASLLLFNILPIYPLDGGQILRSLLWFVMGKARSLMVAVVIGIIGIVGFIALAILKQEVWFGIISVYLLFSCWGGLQHARVLLRQAKLPRRSGFACPACKATPPIGPHWRCGACQQPFDTFETMGECPHCSARFNSTMCIDCHAQNPLSEWAVATYAGAGTVNGGQLTK
jgi:Zn-dependent protease